MAMLSVEFVALVGLAGLAVGSFLNVCIDRLPRGESIVAVASHCESCGQPLALRDLVPVFSFFWLRGRCRRCKARISWRLPMVELATAVLFAFIAFRYGPTALTLVALAFVSVLLVIFVVDLERSLILDKVVYPSMAFALLTVPWGPAGHGLTIPSAYLEALKGFLLAGGVLLVIYRLARGGFGLGDVKLGALVGVMMGFIPALVALQIAFVVGGLVAVALLGLRLRRLKDPIPFGPFLAGASAVSLLWGQEIFDWYQGIFGS